jgi:hypothetical protein
VSSNLRDKLIHSIRRPSLAGNGLPERMRSTVVAFLGLTAAAGLALVAIFAQLGFPLLSPSPLPSAPAESSSVSKGMPLTQGSAVGLARAQGAVAAPGSARDRHGPADATHEDRGADVDGSADPVPDSSPGDSPADSEPVATPTPDPAAAPTTTTTPTTTESTPAPVEVPASSPETGEKPDKSNAVDSKPDKPEAKPAAVKPSKPEAKPAKTKPVKPAKTKPPKPEAAPAPEASYVPASAPASVEKGKEKEEKDEKSK